ncbi:MAG: GatB/YqeY domain-containing protein [Candidatus Eremiobacterota bacterium]
MAITARIDEAIKQAMKAREAERLGALRMLKAAFKNESIELGRELDDEAAVRVLSRLCKQRRESIEQFTRGNRPDLAEKEARELAILEEFLPAAPSEAELEAALQAALAETGASSPKEMGLVMKAVMARFQGRPVDGKSLSARVRAALGG